MFNTRELDERRVTRQRPEGAAVGEVPAVVQTLAGTGRASDPDLYPAGLALGRRNGVRVLSAQSMVVSDEFSRVRDARRDAWPPTK